MYEILVCATLPNIFLKGLIMRRSANFVCLLIILGAASAFGSATINTITCDSFMEMGLKRHNEKGVFNYIAQPLKVSVLLLEGEVVLTDSDHLCRLKHASNYSTRIEGDFSSSFDLTLTSVPNGDDGNGGHISLGNGSGVYTCPYLSPMGDPMELSNCVAK